MTAGVTARSRRSPRPMSSRLQPVWSFSTGQVEGHQAPPIVNNGVMFVATPGNQLLALEAKTGNVLWRYKRPLPEDMTPLHPTNRGVGLLGDKVYFAAAESVLVALDAKTGKEVWTAKVDDYKVGHYMSLTPLVIDGKVLVARVGRRIGHTRFPRRLRRGNRQGALEDLFGSSARRARQRDLAGGRRSLQARRRHDVGDGQLRSGNQSHVLGHRQRRPLVRRSAPGRQSLHDRRSSPSTPTPAPSKGTSSITRTTPGTGTKSRRRSCSTINHNGRR